MNKLNITKEEFMLALTFAILGFIFSMRNWLLWLNGLSPIYGMLVYYAIIGAAYFILSKFGLVIMHKPIKNVTQIIGLIMITFSFFIIFGWTSQYVQLTTMNNDAASPIFYQCEDGSVWYFWHTIMNVADIEQARLLTFVLTPFVLTLIGGLLVAKPKLNIL